MKRLTALALVLSAAIVQVAGAADLRQTLFQLDDVRTHLSQERLSSGSPGLNQAPSDPADLNPGKALLLSAIIPGAGQYSIGSYWRAALFISIEAVAWTGVVYYYNQGMDKDKEFKAFADNNFAESEYRRVEFDLARNPLYGDSGAYVGTEPEWIEEPWEVKIHFLPGQGFTHELPTDSERRANKSHDQQYYEMIGKYIRQFGFGWNDNFGDDLGTPWFDGRSERSERYMDMRYDSNRMLDFSSYAMQAALLNHVAAALDASFTVRAMKRKARAQVGFRSIQFDGHPVAVGGLHFRW